MNPAESGEVRNGGRPANDTIEDFALCHLPLWITASPMRFPDTLLAEPPTCCAARTHTSTAIEHFGDVDVRFAFDQRLSFSIVGRYGTVNTLAEYPRQKFVDSSSEAFSFCLAPWSATLRANWWWRPSPLFAEVGIGICLEVDPRWPRRGNQMRRKAAIVELVITLIDKLIHIRKGDTAVRSGLIRS